MGGLDLRRAGVVDSQGIENDARSVYDMLDAVKEQMRDTLGVQSMPAPTSQPTPLAELDIATLTNRELGALHTRYVAHSVFINGKLAEIICLEKAARINVKKAASQIKNQLRAEGVKAAEITARVETHPVYEEYLLEALKLFMMKEIATADHRAFKDMAAALSRNVTLRELEFEQTRREDNVSRSKGKRSGRPRRPGFGQGSRGD